jgi:mono/diheme cytochrome c family protein
MRKAACVCLLWVAFATQSLAEAASVERIEVRTDAKSIEAGKVVFKEKCRDCHYPDRSEFLMGPGLKGILKNPKLPVSNKPATPENVAAQIGHPYGQMPLFRLSEETLLDLIAYLNTL